MPLVTTEPGSEVAPTTSPPGHMQKLQALRLVAPGVVELW